MQSKYFSAVISATVSFVIIITMMPFQTLSARASYEMKTYSDYVMNKLPSAEKKLYNNLLESCNTVDDDEVNTYTQTPKAEYGSDLTPNEATEVALIFKLEHPEFFWLGNEIRCMYINGATCVLLDIDSEYQSGAKRAAAKKKIISKINSYLSSASGNSYEKVKFFHDALISNISYGGNESDCQNISTAFLNNKTVCAGYSKAFTLLCNASDIPAISVAADHHMWNMVKIGSSWYCIDVTQDDKDNGSILYTNFLLDYNSFRKTASGTDHEISVNLLANYGSLFPKCTDTSRAEAYKNSASPSGSSTVSSSVSELKAMEYPYTGIFGDANGDKSINSKDATAILCDYAYSLIKNESKLKKDVSDVDGDGKTTSKDASVILKYYSLKLLDSSIGSLKDYVSE